MSIATEISRIQQAKADIKTAIEAKGVTVPSSAKIDTYDDYVSQISGGGGGTTPSAFTSWKYDNYGYITNFVLKNSVTSIPSHYQQYNASLSSCTIHSGVTSIGTYAFANVGQNANSLDVSNINLSGLSGGTGFSYIFNTSYVKGNFTIPNKIISGATSGNTTTIPCYGLFNGCIVQDNNQLTINVYADGVVIPRYMLSFSNATTSNSGKIDIIIHGTPTFLSRQSIKLISGNGVDEQSVTFADCTTPPDAESYGTSSSSPFYQFTGTVYVPSAGLSAWKAKYTGIESKIKAIGT